MYSAIFLDAKTFPNKLEYVLYIPESIVKFSNDIISPAYTELGSSLGNKYFININKHITFATDYLYLWKKKATIKFIIISNEIVNDKIIKLQPYHKHLFHFKPTNNSITGEKNIYKI